MLPKDTSPIPEGQETAEQRRSRIREQLLAAALPLIDQLADTLAAAPERELFRAVEREAQAAGRTLAAAAQQAALDGRKKGGT